MPSHDMPPPHNKTPDQGRRNIMIGAAVVVVLAILLFVFMTPNRTTTTNTMQGTGTQQQGELPPAGTADPMAPTTTDPAMDPAAPADPGVPADPGTPADPAAPTTQP